MKAPLSFLAILALCGCTGDDWHPAPPTAPSTAFPSTPLNPLLPGYTWLWGMVIEDSGGCITAATVHVVRGQRAGETVAQETPCGAWDYGGGFTFWNLKPGVSMTFHLSALGYLDLDTTVAPTTGPQMAFLFVLRPVPKP